MENEAQLCTQELMDTWTDSFAAPAFLCGFDKSDEAMRDDSLRAYLGSALMHEIMPYLPYEKKTVEASVIAACAMLENRVTPVVLMDRIRNLPERMEKEMLPLMDKYATEHFAFPPCLTLSLAAMMMLFAGTRRSEEGGYTLARGEDVLPISGDEEMLEAMSHLSCDMAAESMVYAVLSDRVVWTRDLRDVPGLEDSVTGAITDIQLLGMRDAMKKAADSHKQK
ncbi:MAG: hypothetical protein E7326_07075 [Clostridiales bacterium]|nr:hypothetical protein [Clostridiales bacterium]